MVKHLKLFKIEESDGALVVAPLGQGSGFRYHDLHQESNAVRTHLLKTKSPVVIMDMEQMEYCGSEFIGSLISMLRETRNRGGKAAFCSANSHMHKVLENMSLFKLWPYFETREDAVSALTAEAS
ncbi:MAG: anti-sigma factor antagonist [Planctomycetota bacterium]|nr:MAG: anti-sigma factor antagonist [Planctomycetota bacterium]REJ92577.1 MAG: anti-sigma factor antagonist [Planctomycetota bacterium]REK28940.1 MAG: anti-sigma factor antagonist [Planctomycetota bacterium]REK39626.1 MAG: anti-sigma factor antagonist [Planctomycetota bacterium]